MNDTVKVEEDVVAPLEKIKQQLNEPPAARSGWAGFLATIALLLILLLAAALAAGAYYLWPQWQELQQRQNSLLQTQQQLHSQEQQQQEALSLQQQQLERQLQQARQELQQQQRQQADQLTLQLQAVRQQLLQRDSAPPRHWLLAEVQYLLQLAGQKVWLEQDIATARLLLTTADEKLASLDDSSLLTVRQAIATDLQQLNTLPLIDRSAVFLKLHQLQQQVPGLPLRQQEQALSLTLPQPDSQLENWRSTVNYYWQNTWSKIIRVSPATPEDYFSLTTEQQLMVRLSLSQQLAMAELAAVRQLQAPYQQALQRAADQLQRYFSAEHDRVNQLGQQLAELAAVQLSYDNLKPLGSLASLQQYLQTPDTAEDGL